MVDITSPPTTTGLEAHGIVNPRRIYWNLTPPRLVELAVLRGEGMLTEGGGLTVYTGKYTGRSPRDKFIVREPSSEDRVWWGPVNQPFEPEAYEQVRQRLMAFLQDRELFVQDLFACADPRYRLPVRVITTTAWQSLFAWDLFIRPTPEQLASHQPEFVVISAPEFKAIPEIDGTRSEVFILLNLARKEVLVGGTAYAGEIKKSIFTALNYLLPMQGVFPMHCGANAGPDNSSALFFGLSGTGKTSLSADPERVLVGDDEHGWGENGIFNFEGGCYAKTINLSPVAEPEIFGAVHRFGALLENVVVDPDTRRPKFEDDSITENTRAAYPIEFLPNASPTGTAGHPKDIIFLTADAFGVLPPIARLTEEQAIYHFLSGYTSKLAGTERGVTEPEATFSSCFGAPFLVLPPVEYGRLLDERVRRYGVKVWLVNTGWVGGPYGVGERIKIQYSRAMVRAIVSGRLDDVAYEVEPYFGLRIPAHVPGVPDEVLKPWQLWRDVGAYENQVRRLAAEFVKNFKQYEAHVSPQVRAAGPKVGPGIA